jgi:hypothetical protein
MTSQADPARLSAREEALLVRLADGSLRSARTEARLLARPDCAELVERQRRVVRALRAGPAATSRVEAAATLSRRASTARRTPRARLALVVAGPLALAAVAFVLVTSLPGFGASPGVAQAAALSALPPEQPAPKARAGAPVLAAELEGVPYPDWGREFGWRAIGSRDDVLGDRATRTVFYEHEGHVIGYTIVAGEPLEPPAGAERVRRDGVEIALVRDGERDVAVFVRDGHTCILAGHVIHRSTLVELAAWDAGGAIAF